ncbi:Replicase polyprotein 1ab [Micromonospora sp. WMMD1102]|uniref:tetratricopeptide repeat protein n=1 Tax=Micromonospora sp. WMMD1102 TaxID=3016105 RepID=UPI0024152E5E|nr:Replicase polyprotein 1ab [Micromonospora sp. WMMD1102]MDG4788123.1 Replicase polyprotein 1ab [Micromonospora sp. WMMD1102]
MLSLAKPVAETVARHLVATGALIDDDPNLALEHALAARRLAARIAPVREAVGLAAYRAGEWQTAIAELRTYHRMSGRQTHLAVLADCERALGRPERAIDLYRGADRESLSPAGAVELLIVAAGARGDMGQRDAAVAMLQVRELTATPAEPWTARLRYAYAGALLTVDRREEAREWFSRAAEVDEFGETDAAERLLELDGVVLEGDDYDDEDDEATDGGDRVPADAEFEADADVEAPDEDGDEDEDGYDEDDADEEDEDYAQPVGEADVGAGERTAEELADAGADAPGAAAEVGAVTGADESDPDPGFANADVAKADAEKADADVEDQAKAGADAGGGRGEEGLADASTGTDAPDPEAEQGSRPVRGAES